METGTVGGQEDPFPNILASKLHEAQRQPTSRARSDETLAELKEPGMDVAELPAEEIAKLREKAELAKTRGES